jgi:hypothetical protein
MKCYARGAIVINRTQGARTLRGHSIFRKMKIVMNVNIVYANLVLLMSETDKCGGQLNQCLLTERTVISKRKSINSSGQCSFIEAFLLMKDTERENGYTTVRP